jgi:V8-like Glu-specific endopeptidase
MRMRFHLPCLVLALFATSLAAAAEADRGANPPQRGLFGPDDRKEITDTTVYPYSAVGELAAVFPQRIVRCTGTLIGPRHVLTAAHCIYDVKTRRLAQEVSFVPGRSGDKAPLGVYPADRWIAPYGFKDAEADFYTFLHLFNDIGIVVLKEEAGEKLGWLDYGVDPGDEPFVVNVVGFPADKRDTMWLSSCVVEPPSEFDVLLTYDCDTLKGTSGAGVYTFDAAAGRGVIYAVNIGGNLQYNTSLRISAEYYCWLTSIVEDRNACPSNAGLAFP